MNNEIEVKEKTYTEQKKELKENLNLNCKELTMGKDLTLSSFGTIIVDGEEISFDNFIKNTQEKIKTGQEKIKYDKATTSFYLIRDVEHNNNYNNHPKQNEYKGDFVNVQKIVLYEDSMNDLANGKLDNYTSRLRNLWMETEKIEKRKAHEKNQIIERDKIIAKAKNNFDDLTPIEARTYLDHLKKEDKINNSKITKNSATIVAAAAPPVVGAIIAGTILAVPGAPIIFPIIGGALGATMGGIAEGTVRMFTGNSDYFRFTPIDIIKRKIDEIIESRNTLKVNKIKENQLRRIKYVDKMVMPKSVTIEEREPIEELDLEDNIMSEIDNMVNKVSTLNSEDKSELLGELKNLLNVYVERKTNIVSDNKQVENDNLVKLRNDICRDLAKIELRANNIKNKDIKTKAITKESNLLSDKIDKVDKMKTEELEDMFDDFEEETKEEENTYTSAK